MSSRTSPHSEIRGNLPLGQGSHKIQKDAGDGVPQRSLDLEQADSCSDISIYASSDSGSDSDTEQDTQRKRRLGPKPYTPEKRARVKEDLNARRRENYRSRVVSREEIAPLIAETWSSTLSGKIDHWRQILQVHEQGFAPLECIQEIVRITRVRDAVRSVSDYNALWQHIGPVIPLLYDLSLDPVHFDPTPWLENGALVECFGDEEKQTGFQQFYIRCLELDVTTAIEATYNYLVDSPADAEWTMLRLLALGEDMPDILAALETALESCGHGPTVKSFTEFAGGLDTAHVSAISTGAHAATSPPSFLYIGTTSVSVYDRYASDRSARWTRYVNLNNANKELLASRPWRVFTIPALDIPVSNALAMRSNPLISAVEATLIDVCSGFGTNSARGGYTYGYVPPLEVAEVVAGGIARAPNYFLGNTALEESTQRTIRAFVDDEIQYWYKAIGRRDKISLTALNALLKNLISVARTLNGSLIQITIADDISLEDYSGAIGGVWDTTTGRGFQEYRQIVGLIHPEVSHSDNLTEGDIAAYVGPMVNVWRVVPHKNWCGRHLAFLSRILVTLQPLLIETLSATVASAFLESEIPSILESDFCRSEDGQRALGRFWAGNSNIDDIEQLFPHAEQSPQTGAEYRHNEFTHIQGEICIVRYGPDPTHLALCIPMRQPSSFAYDPRFSQLRHDAQLLVQAKKDVLSRVISDRLILTDPLDFEDKKSKMAWLNQCKDAAQKIVVAAGIQSRLDDVKHRLRREERAVLHLRNVPVQPASVEKTERSYQRREGAWKTAVGRDARLKQLRRLREQEADRAQRCLPSTRYIIPNGMDVSSDTFETWFLGLRDNIDIAASAKTYGNTEGARRRQVTNQNNIGPYNAMRAEERRRERLDPKRLSEIIQAKIEAELAQRKELLCQAVENISSLEHLRALKFKKGVTGSLSTIDTWRYVRCNACDNILIGKDKNSKHLCSATARTDSDTITLTEDNFPDITRLLYAHDIFDNADLVALLNRPSSLFGLVSLLASDILGRHLEYFGTAGSDISARVSTISGCVYVPEGCADLDDSFAIALAFDKALQQLNTCSPDWLPLTAHNKYFLWKAQPVQAAISKIMTGKKGVLYLGKCDYGWHTLVPNPPQRDGHHWYAHGCTATVKPTGGSRGPENSYNGWRNCKTAIFLPVGSIWDLPADFSRRLWFMERVQNTGLSFYNWHA